MENQMEAGNYYGTQQHSALGQIKSTVAKQLSSAAQALHQQSARTERPTEFSKFGEQAAGWLERSADYVNEFEPQRLKTDLETEVRRNPGRSLLIAGVAGLVLGKLLRRR